MELLMKKTIEDLMAISLERLNQTQLNEISRGGIARLFLSVINDNIAGFYDTLQTNHMQAFLSTATGAGIDEIGFLLACNRNSGEGDEEYRARISQQVLSAASANETAIKLAALSVADVQDVTMKKYTLGTGSFSIFVVTKEALTSEATINSIREAVDKAVGYGIKYDVAAAGFVMVEMKIKLMFTASTDVVSQAAYKSKAVTAMKEYLNSRALGETLIINEITQRIMDVSEDIVNYQLHELKIDGKRVLNKDQNCKWNERFIESSIPNAIIVTV